MRLDEMALGEWQMLVLAALLTSLLVYPVGCYLSYSLVMKGEEILGSLTEKDKQAYLSIFHRGNQIKAPEGVSQRFKRIYNQWYGRRRYALPIFGLIVAGFADSAIMAHGLLSLGSADGANLPAAAAAGGYAYVANDLILRQQRRDLSASDVLRGALRLAIAIPLGMAFSSLIVKDSAFLAFAVGVFPLDTIGLILRRLFNKKLELEVGVDGAKDQVSALMGIDAPTADRIQQADITTIPQLARCDPVQLSMRSNLGFSYVLDIVSQALAWVYLSDKLPLLAPLGLRGSVEIRSLMLVSRAGDADGKARADAVISQAAEAVNVKRPGLVNAFDRIADDPATIFLHNTIVRLVAGGA